MLDEQETPISGPNPLCPERMSAQARLAEIGRILAAGVMRLNAAQSSGLSAETGDSFVDFLPRKRRLLAQDEQPKLALLSRRKL